ncbi:beta-ketoacyl synthase N-terminal-like domain-containing protein [Streptomyces sp. P9(2023)]|uniref:type I polyketide synthase n=1 Tax=Streptomyces sp. P9(2023) TaxID=3064394 RepID=UPI0028F43364|nr:beta-ketoacyl synthase N-terminal-like domain-containing protein [Streptomyces sp. P9(2023)]MDT9691508.1 beta-ketoacyl synthase N-terminal-like domain-containing protein [Streptomyces sp. P9(2023)]
MNDVDPQGDADGFIAVVGMAGRFPGAADIDEFWAGLAAGTDSITRETPYVLPGGAADGSDLTYVPSRGRLDGAEWFDADYFGYSAKEAFLIDPQHRVFLECSVAALEDAGQDPDRFPGAIGVYGGSTETQYAQALSAQRGQLPGVTEDDIVLGTSPDFLVARTSERLGLRGPAVAVQSACATALVAIHTAGRGLLAGDCDLALAGGVAVHVPPKKIVWTGPDGTLAPDGVCRAFDARGQGTVASNGVGVVVLKRLSDALADGDHIRAVLRGSAVSNDGSARIGFTAPSVAGQATAVREAQLAAGTDARTITYVEAHGTATPLGDPIEVAALTQAFRADTDERGFCSLGSVKTNIGHADAAAGAAGFIKTVLALGHRQIPPSLHFTEANPQIDFAASPFRVARELQDWTPADGTARRAGVSSFAVGGVNAHLVLEEAPRRPAQASERRAQLLVHSARTGSALRGRLDRFASHLAGQESPSYADMAWTLQTGRREHAHRAFAVAVTGAGVGVGDGTAQEPVVATALPRERPVAFLFPGRVGPAEAWRLHTTEPAFRQAFDAVLSHVGAPLATSVREVARGLAWPGDPAVRDTYVFAFEYALAALWRRWGIRPAAAYGTGVGSLVAGVVAGALPLADALRLIADPAGSPAGDDIRSSPPRIPVVLGDGRWYGADETIDTDRWARELRDPGHPDAALTTLLTDPERVLLQVGAGSSLITSAGQQPAHTPEHLLLAALPDLDDGGDALAVLYQALGRLWLSGATVSWEGVHDGEPRARVPLPTYPFERLPYLVRHPAEEAQAATGAGAARAASGPADGTPADDTATVSAAGGESPRESDGPPADDTPLGLVLRLFGEALGLTDIEPDESFFELGGDSLVGVKLLARIRETYQVEIPMRSLFTSATAADLAALIERQLADPDRSTREASA